MNRVLSADQQTNLPVTANEPMPVEITCSINPTVVGYLLAKNHPFMDITDETGRLAIEGLPIGKVTFQFWHPAIDRSELEVTMKGKAAKWRRGRLEVDLQPGENDLGTIVVTP